MARLCTASPLNSKNLAEIPKDRFPLLFQRTCHEAVLWLDGLVLSLGAFGVVAGSFQSLLPVLFQSASLLLQIVGRAET